MLRKELRKERRVRSGDKVVNNVLVTDVNTKTS